MNSSEYRRTMSMDMIREAQQYDETHPPKLRQVEPKREPKEEVVTILDNGLLDGVVCCMTNSAGGAL